MKNHIRSIISISAILLLAACGGGGSQDPQPSPSTLSIVQKNFETTTLNDTYVVFEWNLPTTNNVTPISGTNYLYSGLNHVQASPFAAPQINSLDAINLTSGMALPDLSKVGIQRILKSGTIYVDNQSTKQYWAYADNAVQLQFYANDGSTFLYSLTYDQWSTPIPLTGTIADTAILRSFIGFTQRSTDVQNFDFTKPWLNGASYFTRKSYASANIVFVYDWTGTTSNDQIAPITTTATTIEDLFASSLFSASGGFVGDNVIYKLTDGNISTVEGVRMWVAKTKRPTSSAPTDTYFVFFELGGKIYIGSMQKQGTRFKYLDGIDHTVVVDYSIRLNLKAAESLKQAVKF